MTQEQGPWIQFQPGLQKQPDGPPEKPAGPWEQFQSSPPPSIVSTPISSRPSDEWPHIPHEGIFRQMLPRIPDVIQDADTDAGRRQAAAARGIDMRTGLPFLSKVRMAMVPNVPSLQRDAARQEFAAEIKEAAESGEEFLKFDGALGEMLFRRKITQNDVDSGLESPESIGQSRWTVLNTTDFDLPELASFMAAAVSPSKGGVLRSVGKTGFAAVAGREIGNAIETAFHYARTGQLPSPEESLRLFGSDVGLEFAASLLGEAGSRLLIEPVTNYVQKKLARRGALGKPVDVAEEAGEVVEEINQVVKAEGGKGEFAPSVGEVLDDPAKIVAERSQIQAASVGSRAEEAARLEREKRALREYTEARFGGDPSLAARQGEIVQNANTTFKDGQTIHIGSVDDRIHVFPGAGAAEGKGVEIAPIGDRWRVQGENLEGLEGLGFGEQLYKAAAQEARERGALLESSSALTRSDVARWKALDGTPEAGKLRWNVDPNNPANWNGDILIHDGASVVEMVPQQSMVDDLLAAGSFRGEGGRFTNLFKQFLNDPPTAGLRELKKEVGSNALQRQKFVQALYDNYRQAAIVRDPVRSTKGNPVEKFDFNRHSEWLDENWGVLEAVMDPSDLVRLVQPGRFKKVLENVDNLANAKRSIVNRALKEPLESNILKDNKQLVNRIAGMESRRRQRFFRMLRATDPRHAEELQGLMRENVAAGLRKRFGGGATTPRSLSYNQWLTENKAWLGDVFGAPYVRDLETLGKALEIGARRSGIRGAAPEVNNGPLQVFRSIFGPLSRQQRFITAGRKLQLNRLGESAIEVITDPAVLRGLIEVRDLTIDNRRAAQFLSRYGIMEIFGEDEAAGISQINSLIEEARALEDLELP